MDITAAPGVDARVDLRGALPLAGDSVDCIAAIHVLQDLAWPDIRPVLEELHRVLKRGGVLRLALPDLDKAIDAYRAGDGGYFYVPDEHARSVGAKLVTQITWYGSVRTPFTFDCIAEWLEAAHFAGIRRAKFGESSIDGLAQLDNRERETLFVEAVKRARAAQQLA